MSDTRPMTSQELDDGWSLDGAFPDDDKPYLEYSIEVMTDDEIRATSSGFKKALRERNRRRQLKRRIGKAFKRFSRRSGKRAKRERSY